MKYFFDTEFIEDGEQLELVSIGIVAEDGRAYYAVSTEFDKSKASDWVKQNVLSKLEPITPCTNCKQSVWKSKHHIANDILDFIGDDKPTFWAKNPAYDWVLLCRLLGGYEAWPQHWKFHCMDLKMLKVLLDNPEVPHQSEGTEHNALEDAHYNYELWTYLKKYAMLAGLSNV